MFRLARFNLHRRYYSSLNRSNIDQYLQTLRKMGVQKQLISEGNGTDRPKKGDQVTMEYTGWVFDPNATDNKGKQFDSSVGRGDFKTSIGVGQVIRGWDEGILGPSGNDGMTLGEKATLVISRQEIMC